MKILYVKIIINIKFAHSAIGLTPLLPLSLEISVEPVLLPSKRFRTEGRTRW